MQAHKLLDQAGTIFDNPQLPFADTAAHEGWRTGFTSGAVWMRSVMEYVRGENIPPIESDYNKLGIFKYGLASVCALACGAFVSIMGWWSLLPLCVLVFYLVEAQMVFLFPLSLDGSPVRSCSSWTRRAGGTLHVTCVVMQLAAVMLFGGFTGNGFVRSWALGCIAIVLWYEELRDAQNRIT
jgi:hypothetical protein